MSKRRYGLPWCGSKSQIAEWVLEHIEGGRPFVDAFAGGCAVTDCALSQGKFTHIIANDVLPTVKLFDECRRGRIPYDLQWVDRAEFHKTEDLLKRLLYSFGNGLVSYAFARWIEPIKRGLFNIIVWNDYSEWDLLPGEVREGVDSVLCEDKHIRRRHSDAEIIKRRLALSRKFTKTHAGRIYRLDAHGGVCNVIRRYERLLGLQETATHPLTCLQCDYTNINIPSNAVVYCDIPYKGTDTKAYGKGFDRMQFYNWASRVARRGHDVYISEYSAPPVGELIAEKSKLVLATSDGSARKCTERLYLIRGSK